MRKCCLSCPVLFLSLQVGEMKTHSSGSWRVMVQGKYGSLDGWERQSCDSQCGKARNQILWGGLSSYWQSLLQDISAYQQDLEKKRGSQQWENRLGTKKGSWTCSTLWDAERVGQCDWEKAVPRLWKNIAIRGGENVNVALILFKKSRKKREREAANWKQ